MHVIADQFCGLRKFDIGLVRVFLFVRVLQDFFALKIGKKN